MVGMKLGGRMEFIKKILVFFAFSCWFSVHTGEASHDLDVNAVENKKESRHQSVFHKHAWKMYSYKDLNKQKCNTFFKNTFDDFFNTGRYIFKTDTLKVLSWTMPFYMATRHFDENVHQVFYDSVTHTNHNQIPGPLHNIILKDFYPIPYVVCGMLGFMRSNDEKRRESQIFMAGLAWVFGIKYVIKELLYVDANLRPRNEHFPNKPTLGGSPSGHTAMAVYTTTYLAYTAGIKGALPMGIFSALVGCLSVTTNTHFVSQVVAGAGVGVMVALSSVKVLEKWKDSQLELNVVSSKNGRIGLSCAYNF